MWIFFGVMVLMVFFVVLFWRHRTKLDNESSWQRQNRTNQSGPQRPDPMNESGPQREDRILAELKPFFRREIVEAKVESLFTGRERAQVLDLLDDDLPDYWGLERLQLAILRLSDGSLTALREYVAAARADYIKVIGTVEYPSALKIGLERFVRLSNPEQESIAQRDLREYVRWLESR
jgi:hypothetical protein